MSSLERNILNSICPILDTVTSNRLYDGALYDKIFQENDNQVAKGIPSLSARYHPSSTILALPDLIGHGVVLILSIVIDPNLSFCKIFSLFDNPFQEK